MIFAALGRKNLSWFTQSSSERRASAIQYFVGHRNILTLFLVGTQTKAPTPCSRTLTPTRRHSPNVNSRILPCNCAVHAQINLPTHPPASHNPPQAEQYHTKSKINRKTRPNTKSNEKTKQNTITSGHRGGSQIHSIRRRTPCMVQAATNQSMTMYHLS